MERYILPDTPRHIRRKSKNKKYEIVAKYTNKARPRGFWGSSRSEPRVGKYTTEKDAQKALMKLKRDKYWDSCEFEIRKISQRKSQ